VTLRQLQNGHCFIDNCTTCRIWRPGSPRGDPSRLEAFFGDPSGYLAELQRSVSQAFHRLYRQRNHILHGGITSSIALPPTLRTAARLAGEGMDRVARGLYVDNLKPLELAARAKIAVAMADVSMSTDLVSLLGS
jgi:hypothetical protein